MTLPNRRPLPAAIRLGANKAASSRGGAKRWKMRPEYSGSVFANREKFYFVWRKRGTAQVHGGSFTTRAAASEALETTLQAVRAGLEPPNYKVKSMPPRRKRAGTTAKAETHVFVESWTENEAEMRAQILEGYKDPETAYPPDVERPRERADCKNGPRPCPFVSCTSHLATDVDPSSGHLKLNFGSLPIWEMGETCAEDIAERGGTSLEEVGFAINVCRERIRQIEEKALARAKTNAQRRGIEFENQ